MLENLKNSGMVSTSYRLFVYGSLAPGEPFHYLLADLQGKWQKGFVSAHYDVMGWGLTSGYPAIIPGKSLPPVQGYLFECRDLPARWVSLDEFEGYCYERIAALVSLKNGDRKMAQMYVLASNLRRQVFPAHDE